jgi:hypothetical protein
MFRTPVITHRHMAQFSIANVHKRGINHATLDSFALWSGVISASYISLVTTWVTVWSISLRKQSNTCIETDILQVYDPCIVGIMTSIRWTYGHLSWLIFSSGLRTDLVLEQFPLPSCTCQLPRGAVQSLPLMSRQRWQDIIALYWEFVWSSRDTRQNAISTLASAEMDIAQAKKLANSSALKFKFLPCEYRHLNIVIGTL